MPLCVMEYMAIRGYLLEVHVLAMYLICYRLYFLPTCLLQLEYDQ